MTDDLRKYDDYTDDPVPTDEPPAEDPEPVAPDPDEGDDL